MGTSRHIGPVYLQAVVDTYGSIAFGYLHTGKSPEHAVTILHQHVLPFYLAWGLEVEAILTHNGGMYCGHPSHPFENYLSLNNIDHRKTKVGSPKPHGFVERFHRTVMNEFFRTASFPVTYKQVLDLQKELDGWVERHNFERPHKGYRNWGKLPVDTVIPFSKPVWEMPGGGNPVRILPLGFLIEMLNRTRRKWPRTTL